MALLPKIDGLASIRLFSYYLFFVALTTNNFLTIYACAFFAPAKPGRDNNSRIHWSYKSIPTGRPPGLKETLPPNPWTKQVNKIQNTSCNTIDALSIYTLYRMWCVRPVPCDLSISQSGLNRCNLIHRQRPLKRIPVNQFRSNCRPQRSAVSTNPESPRQVVSISARIESK